MADQSSEIASHLTLTSSDSLAEATRAWTDAGQHLVEAARRLDWPAVRHAVAEGVDLRVRDGLGFTALHYAAAYGPAEIVRLLLRQGAPADAQTPGWGRTPLMQAAMYKHTDACAALLGHDARADVRDEDGATALMLAAAAGHARVCEVLVAHGAQRGLRGTGGAYAGRTAADVAQTEACRAMLVPAQPEAKLTDKRRGMPGRSARRPSSDATAEAAAAAAGGGGGGAHEEGSEEGEEEDGTGADGETGAVTGGVDDP